MFPKSNSSKEVQSGNALFLILIAVALFAALSYAITQSGRGSGTAAKEQASLELAQMAQVGADMSNAITRLKLSNGCTDDQISFEGAATNWSVKADGSSYTYTNPSTPADGSCKIFGPNGGNLPPPPPIPSGLVVDPSGVCAACLAPTSWMVSDFEVLGDGTDVSGSTTIAQASDLVLWLGRLTKDQCIAVNNSFGVTNPGGNPPVNTVNGCNPSFQGTYGTCTDTIGNQATELVGKSDFCLDWGGGAMGYLWLHVLIER